MARGTAQFFHGAIPKAASGVQDAWLARIVDILTTYQSNGEQAWELADMVDATPATYDAVYHSVGDRSLGSGSNKGDADIWIRVRRISPARIGVNVMQDYSPTSHTALREYPNTAGDYLSDILFDTQGIEYWVVLNEYEIHIVHRRLVTSDMDLFSVGQLRRPFAPEVSGVARTTSQSGTGNGVVFGLDRDISENIASGQKLWLVNQTPTGLALQNVAVDICDVVAVSALSITLDNVVNTYAGGSLAGMDPQPVGVVSAWGRAPVRDLFYMAHSMAGNTTGRNCSERFIMEGLSEIDLDPDVNGLYHVGQVWIRGGTGAHRGFRGVWELKRGSSVGAQAATKDVMELDWDSTRHWKFFSGNYVQKLGAWGTLLGPNAVRY